MMNKISNTHDLVYPFAQMSRKEHAHAQEDLRCHVDCRRTLLSPSIDRQGEGRRAKRLHAQILLKADASPEGDGWKDQRIVEAFDVGRATVERVRQRFVEQGLEAALIRKPQQNRIARKIDGKAEAHLIAAACRQMGQPR